MQSSFEGALLAAAAHFADPFGWQVRSFARDRELIALVSLDHDPSFEQILWVSDPQHGFVRCLLVCRGTVPRERESSIIELCARINDGLAFGCAEYSFDDRVILFRESFHIEHDRMPRLLEEATSTLLQLGVRYSPAVAETLAGESAAHAISRLTQ